MTPEERARINIDALLIKCGWVIQDMKELNRSASKGVAVREFPLTGGEVDYALFIDGKAAGVIEAKPEGTLLVPVETQAERYTHSVPENIPNAGTPLPFVYESTGVETRFWDMRDPEPRSRRVFAFHRPETLHEELEKHTTLRYRLRNMPQLISKGLRDCQTEAITNLERSFIDARPRALIQMATGSGKTFTAVSFIYRLIKHAGAKRVLFLVDRGNLGKQTEKEFKQYITPDDGRKFTELYNIQRLTSNTIDPVCKVTITTIQRLFSMLKGENEFAEDNEELSQFEASTGGGRQIEVGYNAAIPIETFDFIVTDECHRSIYNLWRQVLEYFDSFLIGLTATPSKQTLGFFNKNLVMEYNHERAVADGVNVGYEVYRIKTAITEGGSKVEAGNYIDKRDKTTRARRWEQLDDDLEYERAELDRSVVVPDQIRTVIRTYKERLFTEIFPGRTEVPKTLIFAKDNSHANDIVEIIREEFGKGNDFCKKITYRTDGNEKPEDLIQSFRNSYNPRIAVTVDMIATGTDIKPLEVLIFMRDVRSRLYFEQMKGRGTRIIETDDFNAVTPDAKHKTHFVIVDAVGVCESDKTESRPLERKKSVSFEKLLTQVAMGIRDEDTVSSLAGRLAQLQNEIDEREEKEVAAVAKTPLKAMTHKLIDALDPDKHIEKAKALFKTDTPSDANITKAKETLTNEACAVFDDPKVREKLIRAKTSAEQTIDTVSLDSIVYAGAGDTALEKSRHIVASFKEFIEKNKNEVTALQIFYSQPYGKRHITYRMVKELAEAIRKPPYNLTTETVWQAYEQLEKSKVRGAGAHKLLTDIISLIRFELGEAKVLEPFPEVVERRFTEWLTERTKTGGKFSAEQLDWLTMIKRHIAVNSNIEMDDFELTPFNAKGGMHRAHQVFGNNFRKIIDELNNTLAA